MELWAGHEVGRHQQYGRFPPNGMANHQLIWHPRAGPEVGEQARHFSGCRMYGSAPHASNGGIFQWSFYLSCFLFFSVFLKITIKRNKNL